MLDAEIQRVLEAEFPGAIIKVLDPMNDQTHLEAVVISEQFEGKSLLMQHRMVMSALSNHFDSVLHALALKTFTPEKWKQRGLS